jgi:hypothetical protein
VSRRRDVRLDGDYHGKWEEGKMGGFMGWASVACATPAPAFGPTFQPFGLLLGGMMETDARDALKLWKSIMTGGVYSLLLRRLSLGLLRARARCFEP